MELINILVCDDDPVFLRQQADNIAVVLEKHHLPARVHTFSDKSDIPESLLQCCDMAFLDIDFPKAAFNGMDIARRLRLCNRDAVIIFVTNYVEYAREGYEVQAFRYLLKKEIPQKLEKCLLLGLEHLQTLRKTYPIQINRETIHLPVEDILYFESQKHTAVAYVLCNGSIKPYRFYGPLSNIEADLEQDGFLRVQKSFLVNMRHILKFQAREIVLTGDISLPASPKTYAELKQKFLFWKGRQ